jgi:adenine-specific DNA-methyltransferase
VRARSLRKQSTDAERALWRRLRGRQLDGFKFRRQHPVGPFFADFACVEAGLVVELDGSQHLEPDVARADATRTQRLREAGFDVLRFDDRQALLETDAVLQVIQRRLAMRHPHPSPLPQAGEGARSLGPVVQAVETASSGDKQDFSPGRDNWNSSPSAHGGSGIEHIEGMTP